MNRDSSLNFGIYEINISYFKNDVEKCEKLIYAGICKSEYPIK